MDDFKFKAQKDGRYNSFDPKKFGRRAARRGMKLSDQTWKDEFLKYCCVYQEPSAIWNEEDWDFHLDSTKE